MALIACSECKHEVSTTAKACPNCGARVQRTKWWPWVLGAPLGFMGFLFVYGSMTGPVTTADLARMETESCIRHKGDGDWRGSSGLTLEEFCRGKGALIGLKRACEIDPAKC